MEDSIIRAIRLDSTEDTNNLNLLLEKEVKAVPAGYRITQICQMDRSDVVLLGFTRTQNETVNGLSKSNQNTNAFSQTLPSSKQLKYLTYLVDSLQPEDFPGVDEITTAKLASQWIAKLKKVQAENEKGRADNV